MEAYITNDALQEQWIKENNPAVAAYLVNFDAGRAATPESDFCDPLDSTGVLNLGIQTLNQRRLQYPRLTEYDLSRTSKYGPQGWIRPLGDPRMVDLVKLYYDHCNRPCKPSEKAIKQLLAWASAAQLKPYSYTQVIARGLTKTDLSTNSGLPAFTKRNKILSESMELAKECAETGRIFPAVIGSRSIRQKQRLIFMAPFEQNLRELSYVYPVMDYLLLHSSEVEGWRGQPYVERAISEQFFGGKVTLLSTDFTAMDTSVGRDQIAMVLKIMKAFFQSQYHEDLGTVFMQSVNQPVLIGALTQPGEANRSRNKKRYIYLTGDHGLFSGLGFTNLAETLLQILLDIEFGYYYPVIAAEVNGDDGAKSIDGIRNLDEVADTFARLARRYGMDCNAEKQLVSYDEVHYLQRVYSPETEWDGMYHGAYPMILTLNSAKNPERLKYLTDAQRAVRLMMIFENLASNPYKEDGYRILVAGSPFIQQWIESGEGSSALTREYGEMVNSDISSNLAGKSGIEQLDVYKSLHGNTGLLDDARILSRSW